MRWLKWIFAYFFDCVHRRITWPHRKRAGRVYVACLDCGSELPYSVEQMRIITADEELRKPWRTRSTATASLALTAITAADPSRTTILGNFEFKYEKEPAACRAYPWYDRVFYF